MHKSLIPLLIFITSNLWAQTPKKDTVEVIYYILDKDSIMRTRIDLDEVYIDQKKINTKEEERRKFLLLKYRVLKVYPYAKSGADNLTMLNANMAKLKTNKEKKKYFKIVENYLENEFEGQLKKLTRSEGQILIKLIHRQTGSTAFDLIKDLKSGWKAFWSHNTAKLFDINLKATYDPYNTLEDFYIETILIKAFKEKRLLNQAPKIQMDYKTLARIWREKIEANKINLVE
jgi:hypothetical protein